MSKKLDVYEEALEAIIGEDCLSLEMARALATDALDQFKSDRDAERANLLESLAGFMITNRLIYSTAPELAEHLNKAGMVTTRGKPWTKATAVRVLNEVRAIIEARLMGAAPVAAVAVAPVAAAPVVEAAVVEAAAPVVEAAVVEAAPVVVADDMEQLLADLNIASAA